MRLTAMHQKSLASLILANVSLFAAIQPGQAQTSTTPFLEIQDGSLPLIFTVPHGGSLKPAGLMNRRYGSLATDAETKTLAAEIDLAIKTRLGASAHFIINNLHRSKLDPNRDITEAAQDDPGAQSAWLDFHAACSATTQKVTKTHGWGLLIDLHGHRHEEPNVEVGMLLNAADLQNSDAEISSNPSLLAKSSIKELVQRTGKPLAELIRGPSSLGSLLEIRGQRSLPSAVRPEPTAGASYYSGAYIIATHGSKNGGKVSAIQLECPWEGVRDTASNRKQFAQRLADALAEFLLVHLHWKRE
jgi:N-formylglutamate amidohydrolase